MKKFIITALALLVAASLLWSGCGENNYESPYDASQGATIGDIDDDSIGHSGGGGTYVYLLSVSDEDGAPLNDIDLWVWVGGSVNGESNYAIDLDITDFIDEDAPDFEGYDDENLPHYITDDHGRVNVVLTIPPGFAGELDLKFDIGADISETTLTVNPAGGSCFNGEDDDSDGYVDALDPECAVGPFGSEE